MNKHTTDIVNGFRMFLATPFALVCCFLLVLFIICGFISAAIAGKLNVVIKYTKELVAECERNEK